LLFIEAEESIKIIMFLGPVAVLAYQGRYRWSKDSFSSIFSFGHDASFSTRG